jgi:drug/metabolite transporter (DMT)-like permease
MALVGALIGMTGAHVSAQGAALALGSGAIASGLGYSLWYLALPGLTPTRAAVVQLIVPVLAALAGVALLGEHVTARLVIAGVMILGGVGAAVMLRRKRS